MLNAHVVIALAVNCQLWCCVCVTGKALPSPISSLTPLKQRLLCQLSERRGPNCVDAREGKVLQIPALAGWLGLILREIQLTGAQSMPFSASAGQLSLYLLDRGWPWMSQRGHQEAATVRVCVCVW